MHFFSVCNRLPFCQIFSKWDIQVESSNFVWIYWNLIVNFSAHFISVMNRSSLCIQTPLTLAHFAQLCYWHGKPCILVLWGIFPLTLNPSNSWKIFSLHRKVGLQKEHKPTKVVRYCDHPEFVQITQSFRGKNLSIQIQQLQPLSGTDTHICIAPLHAPLTPVWPHTYRAQQDQGLPVSDTSMTLTGSSGFSVINKWSP